MRSPAAAWAKVTPVRAPTREQSHAARQTAARFCDPHGCPSHRVENMDSGSLTTPLEGELFNEGRILIKVAIANPPRPDHEIRDAGPAQVAAAFWPSGEISLLIACQCYSRGLTSLALVLHRDFACPPNHERTTGIRHQILKLARTLDGIEDNLQFRSHRDSYESRLRAAT